MAFLSKLKKTVKKASKTAVKLGQPMLKAAAMAGVPGAGTASEIVNLAKSKVKGAQKIMSTAKPKLPPEALASAPAFAGGTGQSMELAAALQASGMPSSPPPSTSSDMPKAGPPMNLYIIGAAAVVVLFLVLRK